MLLGVTTVFVVDADPLGCRVFALAAPRVPLMDCRRHWQFLASLLERWQAEPALGMGSRCAPIGKTERVASAIALLFVSLRAPPAPLAEQARHYNITA